MKAIRKLSFLFVLSSSILGAADEKTVKLPVKLEVPDLKPGHKPEWHYSISARLYKYTKDRKVVFQVPLDISARKENAMVLALPADKLTEGEADLSIAVRSTDLDRFPYRGNLHEKISQKSLAAMKGPVIIKLERLTFYDLTAKVLNAQGKPLAGEPVTLWLEERGGARPADEKSSDKEGKVVFRGLSDELSYSIRSGRSDDPSGSAFPRVTIKPNELPKLKEPVVLRIPDPLAIADVLVQESGGKTVPLPSKWNGPVRLDGIVWMTTKFMSGLTHLVTGQDALIKDGKLYVFQGVGGPGKLDVFFPQKSELAKNFVIISGATLKVPKPGAKPESARIVVKKRENHPLRIRVVNADNQKPIAGANVTLRESDYTAFDGTTDKEGLTGSKSFPEGTYRMEVSAKGYKSNLPRNKGDKRLPEFPPALKFFGEKSETVALVPLRTVTVQMKDRAGKAVVGMIVVFMGLQSGTDPEAKTNEKGIAIFKGLREGEGFVIAGTESKTKYRIRYCGPVTVKGNTTTTLTLPPEIAVSGTVAGPEKLVGYRVAFVLKAAKFPVASAVIGKDSSYQLESIPGKYEVYVASPDEQKFYPAGAIEVSEKTAKMNADFKVSPEAWKKPAEHRSVVGGYDLVPRN